MTHPLTDEVLQQIGCSNPRARVFDVQSMRATADWQLEQAIAWLREHLDDYLCEDDYKTYFLTDESLAFLDDFKKAMRPTQEDN